MDILFELYALSPGQGVQWPPFNMILLKRILESGFINVQEPQGQISIGGMHTVPNILSLNKKGRDYIADLGIHEL